MLSPGLCECCPLSIPGAYPKGEDRGVESACPFPGKPGRVSSRPSTRSYPRNTKTC